MRWRAIVLGLLAAVWLPLVPAQAGSGACARFGPMAVAGKVGDSRVVELSGLAASRRHQGVLWAHNDSGGGAEVFALGTDGRALGAYPVTGASATDWEDMAVGPGPSAPSYLYLGDIGDNGAERASVTVYRVAEPASAPSGPGAALAGAEAIQLKYPGGPADAEALLVDPRTGELIIVTKALSGISRVLTAPSSALHAGPVVTMTDRGTIRIPVPSGGSGLPGTMVTGADISPDGSVIVLRTYRSVLLYSRGAGSVAAALRGSPCFGPHAQEPQGEAVAFTRDGGAVLTASEGSNVPIHRSGRPSSPAASTTTTTSRSSGGGGATGTTASPTSSTSTTSSSTSSTTTTTDASTTTREDGEVADRADDTETGGDSTPSSGGGRAAAAAAVALGAAGLTAGALWWARRRRSVG